LFKQVETVVQRITAIIDKLPVLDAVLLNICSRK